MSNYLTDQSLAATYSNGGGGGGHHDEGYDSSGYDSYGSYGGHGHGGGGGGCVVSAEQWLGAVLIAGTGVAIAAAAFGALYLQLTSGKRKRRMITEGSFPLYTFSGCPLQILFRYGESLLIKYIIIYKYEMNRGKGNKVGFQGSK